MFVGRVQASLREMEQTNAGVRRLHPQHGHRRIAAARHHRQQRAGRGGHGAVQGQAGRAQRRRGRGQLGCHALPEFTLLGDALWLDFVNSARGRTPFPPDLLPDSAAFGQWSRLHSLDAAADPVPFPLVLDFSARLTELAEAMRDGRQAPAGAIAALNEQLAWSTGSRQLIRVGGRVAAPVRAGPRATARSRPSHGRPPRPWPTAGSRCASAPETAAPCCSRRGRTRSAGSGATPRPAARTPESSAGAGLRR